MEESVDDAQIQLPEANPIRPCKIVSSFSDVLKLNEKGLHETLTECIKGLPNANPEQQDLPVAIFSIIGPPSCGKSFLTNLVINYYNSDEDDGGWLEKLTKISKEGAHRKFNGFTWHSVTSNPPPGIFTPSDEEMATSGVYLWPQIFIRNSNENGKSMLVLILHLCLGRDKTDDDVQTLERFLIMTSSRMAEIDYGNNDFRILNEVVNIKSAMNELPVACQTEQYCDSIVYIFSSNGASSSTKSSADEEAKEELLQIGQDLAGNKIKDPSVLNTFKHVNIAHIKHIKGTLEDSLLKVEKNMTRSLKKIAEQITDESEVAPKMVKEIGAEKNLLLPDIAIFFRATVDEVNAISSRLQLKRGAIDYSNFQVPRESGPLPVPSLLPDNDNDEVLRDQENLQPSLDSLIQTKPSETPQSNEQETKSMIQPPKLDICDFGAIKHQIQEPDSTPRERQTSVLHKVSPVGVVDLIPSNDVTFDANLDDKPNQLPNIQDNESCPDSSANMPQETAEAEELISVPVDDIEMKESKNEDKNQEPEPTQEKVPEVAANQDSNDMMKVIDEAVAEIKRLMFSTTETWLRTHLSHSNISEISQIYNRLFQEVTERAHVSFGGISSEKLNNLIDNECRASCEAYLEVVESRIKKFYSSMKRQFELLDCFSENELTDVGNSEYAQVSSGIPTDSSEILHLVHIGCKILMVYFQAQNVKIITHEEGLAKQLSFEATNFYNEEMRKFLLDEIYPPNRLMQIHTELTDKLISSLRMAFKLISRESICHTVEATLEALRGTLTNEFSPYFKENSDKLREKHMQIKTIQRNAESSYHQEIQRILNLHPAGMILSHLAMEHDAIVKEARKLFEMDIHKKIDKNEPCEVPLQSLQEYINRNWEDVRYTNNKNLRKTLDQKKKIEKANRKMEEEKRKIEEEKQRMDQERENAKRKLELKTEQEQLWTKLHDENAAAGEHVSSEPNFSTAAESTFKVQQLQPLIFQIQSSRIRMGILVNGKPQILPNSSGEQSTPFVVGLGTTGELIYGSEVFTKSSSQPNSTKKCWQIMKWFMPSGHVQNTENVRLSDGRSHTITVEFLLAFILKNLKRHVEARMNGEFRTGIITIPFWFTSTQRIQVRDGAELAGFSQVYLINETSAAAYACASSENRLSTTNNILVISENDDIIDAFVYSYNIGATKVSMIGHFGSYLLDDGLWNYLKETAYQFWKGTEAEKAKRIKQICKEALAQANIRKYGPDGCNDEPNEVLVFSGSAEWTPILEKVGKDFAKKVCDPEQKNAVIYGAASLGKEPHKIKTIIRDQLAFGIFRKHYYYDYNPLPLLSQNSLLPLNPRRLTTTFLGGNADFFQQEKGKITPVGSFTMQGLLPQTYLVQVCLDIDNEAIIRLKDVWLIPPQAATGMPFEAYCWITPNLSTQEIIRLRYLLDSLTNPEQQNIELSNARQQLLGLCQEMTQQLKGGRVKREDAKTLVAGMIVEAHHVVENLDSTYEDIESKTEELVLLKSTFIK